MTRTQRRNQRRRRNRQTLEVRIGICSSSSRHRESQLSNASVLDLPHLHPHAQKAQGHRSALGTPIVAGVLLLLCAMLSWIPFLIQWGSQSTLTMTTITRDFETYPPPSVICKPSKDNWIAGHERVTRNSSQRRNVGQVSCWTWTKDFRLQTKSIFDTAKVRTLFPCTKQNIFSFKFPGNFPVASLSGRQ